MKSSRTGFHRRFANPKRGFTKRNQLPPRADWSAGRGPRTFSFPAKFGQVHWFGGFAFYEEGAFIVKGEALLQLALGGQVHWFGGFAFYEEGAFIVKGEALLQLALG